MEFFQNFQCSHLSRIRKIVSIYGIAKEIFDRKTSRNFDSEQSVVQYHDFNFS